MRAVVSYTKAILRIFNVPRLNCGSFVIDTNAGQIGRFKDQRKHLSRGAKLTAGVVCFSSDFCETRRFLPGTTGQAACSRVWIARITSEPACRSCGRAPTHGRPGRQSCANT